MARGKPARGIENSRAIQCFGRVPIEQLGGSFSRVGEVDRPVYRSSSVRVLPRIDQVCRSLNATFESSVQAGWQTQGGLPHTDGCW